MIILSNTDGVCGLMNSMELSDLNALIVVAKARGFRKAARSTGVSPSALSEAIRRLETKLGTRLLHRTTRSVTPTEAGAQLLARLIPALGEVEAALEMANNLGNRAVGRLRLNVPVSAARLVMPTILPRFLDTYPDVRVEIIADDNITDVLAAGADAGIRYLERLEQDMIALPIGPRLQRFATAASKSYLDRHGVPQHPRDLLAHACLLGRFPSGALTSPWEFERRGEVVRVEPHGPLIVSVGGGIDLAIEMAAAGYGIVHLFENWLQPHLDSGALQPLLTEWWQPFSGPFIYYSSRRLVPPPLRAFLDFVKNHER